MSAGDPRRRYFERAVAPRSNASLAGVLVEPAVAPAADRPWLVLLNAGILHKIGPNRMTVLLAREAAARGLTSLRFDFAGVGDSSARTDGLPPSEGVLVDIADAISHLQRTRGIDRFVTIGLCSGADNALRAARRDPRVVGVCMLDPTIHRTRRWYVEHFGPRLFSLDVWRRVLTLQHPRIASAVRKLRRGFARPTATPVASPELFRTGFSKKAEMEAHLRDVLARRVQLFIAFSGGWSELYNYRNQIFDVFPRLDFADRLRLRHYPQAEHTFDMEAHRRLLLADIVDWAASAPFPSAATLARPDGHSAAANG